MEIKLKRQKNISGNAKVADQGFGRISVSGSQQFNTENEAEAELAYQFFVLNGFVVLRNCLNQSEITELNTFFDRTQHERPEAWGASADKRKPHHRDQGLIFSQPLLDYPELDKFTQHPGSYPMAARILGGLDRIRYSEFNFRETPEQAGQGKMNFHHDAVVADRLLRKPYLPCDWLCAIHYLTDVRANTPAFCVVPGSNRFKNLKQAYVELADNYQELPVYGPAGTCVLYDTATFHTRLDGDGSNGRRTWHQYYARGGWLASSLPTTNRYVRAPSPSLTNWNLIPERLAMHSDPAKRLFFSHWNSAQSEWVASGFDKKLRKTMPRGEQ